jgi:tetratricopeptide (TPR) repeat protein
VLHFVSELRPVNTEGVLGLGLCYLQMGTYSLAQECFEQVIESSPEVSQAYYYCVLSIINGRRIMTLSLNVVRELETYLTTAIKIDDAIPQYKLLLAMLKRDYYEVNGLKLAPPTSDELLFEIAGCEINENEIERLRDAAKVANQDEYLKM